MPHATAIGAWQDLLRMVIRRIPALKRSMQVEDERAIKSLIPRAMDLSTDVENALDGYASLLALQRL